MEVLRLVASLGESVRSLVGQELLLDAFSYAGCFSYEGCWAHRAVRTHGLPDGAVWE